MSRSEIDKQWVNEAKKKWKNHKDAIEDALSSKDPDQLERSVRKAKKYFQTLQEDLLINKGFWYLLAKSDMRGNEKLREKIVETLQEASTGFISLESAPKYIRKGYRSFEDMEDFLKEELNETDSKLSRIVFASLNRALKEVDKLDLGSFLPDDISLGKAKIIFDEKASKNPKTVWNTTEGWIRHPRARDEYLEKFKKVRDLLKRKGFEHLWYGPIVVKLKSEGQMPSGKFGYAKYVPSEDRLYYYEYPDEHTVYTTIHELGHRQWYKFMSPHDRKAFSAYFETGEVNPVTEYGGTMSEEDFAEVFAHYVTGKGMNRDQLERFKQFWGKRSSVKTSYADELTQWGYKYPQLRPHLNDLYQTVRKAAARLQVDVGNKSWPELERAFHTQYLNLLAEKVGEQLPNSRKTSPNSYDFGPSQDKKFHILPTRDPDTFRVEAGYKRQDFRMDGNLRDMVQRIVAFISDQTF